MVQCQHIFVRLLEAAVSTPAEAAHRDMIGPWQKAWIQERISQQNLVEMTHFQARSIAHLKQGRTGLFDMRSAFSRIKRDGLKAVLEAIGAPPAYIRFRFALYGEHQGGASLLGPPSSDLILAGMFRRGPDMEDGLIQGSRFSCLDMLLAVGLACRAWITTVCHIRHLSISLDEEEERGELVTIPNEPLTRGVRLVGVTLQQPLHASIRNIDYHITEGHTPKRYAACRLWSSLGTIYIQLDDTDQGIYVRNVPPRALCSEEQLLSEPQFIKNPKALEVYDKWAIIPPTPDTLSIQPTGSTPNKRAGKAS